MAKSQATFMKKQLEKNRQKKKEDKACASRNARITPAAPTWIA
jgi:hypothetical protein